eukprot:10475116-Alexandrium_andersonii.AAC.1
MSWPTRWAYGPSGPRRQQTPARERASRTGTGAQCHSPPQAGSRAPPRRAPAAKPPTLGARGG